LRPRSWQGHAGVVEFPLDERDVQTIMHGLFEANLKLDTIIRYLSDEDDGEEEED
jgi:hypothetical protein